MRHSKIQMLWLSLTISVLRIPVVLEEYLVVIAGRLMAIDWIQLVAAARASGVHEANIRWRKFSILVKVNTIRPFVVLPTRRISESLYGLLFQKIIRIFDRTVKHWPIYVLLFILFLLNELRLLMVWSDDAWFLEIIKVVAHRWRSFFHSWGVSS